MQNHLLITKQQARQITRGRTPLVPVEYEAAVKAIVACTTFDEARHWNDKSDALAAWAKIYHSDDMQRKAKQLKLHAFRRMGQLANELRPIAHNRGNTGAGRLPGPVSLLIDNGLNKTAAAAARRLALLPATKFNKILKNPRAPATVAYNLWSTDPAWQDFTRGAMVFRAAMRRNSPAQVVALIKNDSHFVTARDLVVELTEWLDELEHRLSKVKNK